MPERGIKRLQKSQEPTPGRGGEVLVWHLLTTGEFFTSAQSRGSCCKERSEENVLHHHTRELHLLHWQTPAWGLSLTWNSLEQEKQESHETGEELHGGRCQLQETGPRCQNL